VVAIKITAGALGVKNNGEDDLAAAYSDDIAD